MRRFFATVAFACLAWTNAAHADAPAWVCGLKFKGQSSGVQVIVGLFHTEATGRLTCVGINGETYRRDVKITMGTSPIAPSVGIGAFQFVGASADIELFNMTPDAVLGTYIVGDAHASLIGGAGAFAAVKMRPPQLALQVSIQLTEGLGFDAGVHRMKISALRHR